VPNMVVMAPKDENELQHMLYTAVKYNGPVAVRYPRGAGVGASLDWELRELPIGKAELLREGEDLVIFAIGNMVYPALEAAEILAEQGFSAAVVNARFVKPLDEELVVALARQTGRVFGAGEKGRHPGLSQGIEPYLRHLGHPGGLGKRRKGCLFLLLYQGNADHFTVSGSIPRR